MQTKNNGRPLGKPADMGDRIIARRIGLLENTPNFTGKNFNLLDIGCGNGASMFLLSDKMKSCVGIEISDAHKPEFTRYKNENNIQNCVYRVLDVVENRAEEKFDRIMSFEVIEHLSKESGLQFYFDSLKEDGILAVSVPNKWWIFETHGANLPLLPWNRVPFFSWLPKPIHERFSHARIYTIRRIKKLLEVHGFEVLDVQYITAPMDVLPEGKLKTWLVKRVFNKNTTRLPLKATSIFVVAKKASFKPEILG